MVLEAELPGAESCERLSETEAEDLGPKLGPPAEELLKFSLPEPEKPVAIELGPVLDKVSSGPEKSENKKSVFLVLAPLLDDFL